ncbi:hypothetical protein BJ508DRAFT_410359 [Ascobolus immersus RN42]|uniref:Uncharacterized protein n=1 Tax=Ascobolus immersus RN42 TaxID=1160509 RepID=A0A3N4IS81_ASCIM|nr:hypothetical protein BJ508DRAFT_410359 [Ascobolus immersus RN42]
MLEFTVPQTQTAPSHPSNAPCLMRPQRERYDSKPFPFHSNRAIKPQRISFNDLPCEIHFMIYKYALSKDFQKLPSHRDIVAANPNLVREEEETLLMGDAMEDFLQLPLATGLNMLEDGLAVDTWDDLDDWQVQEEDDDDDDDGDDWSQEDGGNFEDSDISGDEGQNQEAIPFFGQPEPEGGAVLDQVTPPTPSLEPQTPYEVAAMLLHQAATFQALPPPTNTSIKPKKQKKIAYTTDDSDETSSNAFELLYAAQRRPPHRVHDLGYVNTDTIWGLLSLTRSCRLVYYTLSPLLIPYLASLTIEMYRHEVSRAYEYTFQMINSGVDDHKFERMIRKNEHLLYWDQTSEDEIRADEQANPEGYAGLTPFNQFPGEEYDEWEFRIHMEEERDWTGMWLGMEGRPWWDVWQLFALICTACHDRSIMEPFLEEYCREIKGKSRHWGKWIVRDVLEEVLRYCRFDPWVVDCVYREFGLKRCLRQRTMDEFVVRLDGDGKAMVPKQ